MARSEHQYTHRILEAIASSEHLTQRSLAVKLGIALGLTNLLVRRLVAKGYVRISNMGPRHVKYFLTPAGMRALGRASRISLENTIHLYTETREQIRRSLSAMSASVLPDARGQKPIVFYGAGDVAEIAFIGLQGTDLELVGVVDDVRRGRFFTWEVQSPDALDARTLAGVPYCVVIVATFRQAGKIRASLDARGIPKSRVVCL